MAALLGAAIAVARIRVASDWPGLLVLDITQALAELGGDCAEAVALRACDSLQLASVMTLHRELPGGVRFACDDTRLTKATRLLGVEPA